MENIEKDIIEEMIEKARKDKVLSLESIEYEIDRTKKHKKMLSYKIQQIQKAKGKEIEVPWKFKKVEDVVRKEDIKVFYFNLFFFNYVEYYENVGYLLSDNVNFYLKITTYTDNFPLYNDFTEELYITEDKAKEILEADKMMNNNCENCLVLANIE